MNHQEIAVKESNKPSETKITMQIPFIKGGLKGMFNVSVSFKNKYQLTLQTPASKPNQ